MNKLEQERRPFLVGQGEPPKQLTREQMKQIALKYGTEFR